MILFHGSNTVIDSIDLTKCKPYKDFGKGFYLTEIESQAEMMARRTAVIYGKEPIVTRFEFDEQAALNNKELKIRHFVDLDRDWAEFILKNRDRNNPQPVHDYDIVIGAVADDAIATLFRNFNDGIIDIDMLINGLKYKKTSSQYLFHTPQSIKYLKKI